MSGIITAALVEKAATAAGKLALSEFKKWAKKNGPKLGEWRGTLVCEEEGGDLWLVGQSDADPCRLWIPAVGLEYSWAGGDWISDGPSIPGLLCKALKCSRKTYLEIGFLHDFMYRTRTVYVRVPGGPWVRVEVTKREADVILWVGVLAKGATEGQATAFYVGVRTPAARSAWNKWRRLEEEASAAGKVLGNALEDVSDREQRAGNETPAEEPLHQSPVHQTRNDGQKAHQEDDPDAECQNVHRLHAATITP